MAVVIIENEPLAKYTSWRIGGPARYFADAPTPGALVELLQSARECDLPVFILGGGTNILVRGRGFAGLVLRYRAHELRIDESAGRAWIAAGAPMAGTVRRLAAQGWSGLEWAEGLPGTIGGAVFGNAGCYGGDIASALTRAWLLIDEKTEEWSLERLGYGYRTSVLRESVVSSPLSVASKPNALANKPQITDRKPRTTDHGPRTKPIVVAAEFHITRADPRELAARMAQTAAERKGKTPVGSSCGSVFKNPAGGSAGRLIEAAGLKGMRAGNAEISHKHANYIVNQGGASSDDILRLIEIARERVLREFGIELELEVQIVG